MIIKTIDTILHNKSLNIKQRMLGLDVSKKHLGISISDELLKLAFPYKTIVRKKFTSDIQQLFKIIDEENITALVVGYPLDLNGHKNYRTQSIESFINEILKIKDIDIFLQDERFSTKFAKMKSKTKNDSSLDSKAASYFLQIFLDKINYCFM